MLNTQGAQQTKLELERRVSDPPLVLFVSPLCAELSGSFPDVWRSQSQHRWEAGAKNIVNVKCEPDLVRIFCCLCPVFTLARRAWRIRSARASCGTTTKMSLGVACVAYGWEHSSADSL